jgi:hypothetical protein
MLDGETIDDLLLESRAGDLEALQEYFTANPESAKELASIKDEFSLSTILHMASANGHIEVVDYLLKLAQNSDNEKEFVNAVNESGNTALHWACLNGHLSVVQALCEAEADPFKLNLSKHDAFYEAECNDKNEVMEYLLKKYDVDDEPDQKEVSSDSLNEQPESNEQQPESIEVTSSMKGLQLNSEQ